MMSARHKGHGHGPGSHMGTRRNPHPEVSKDSHHSEPHQENPSGHAIPQLVAALQKLLVHLGPRQEEDRHGEDRHEKSH